MSAQYDMGDFNAITKSVYGQGIVNIVPENLKVFFDDIPYGDASEQIGYNFIEAVKMRMGYGIVSGTSASGALTYPTAIPGAIAQASVSGFQIANRVQVDYALATQARKKGVQAFEDIVVEATNDLIEGHRRRQLKNLLYGGTQLGIISSGTASATQTITLASFAPGLWFFDDNATFDIIDPTFTTVRNGGTPLVLSGYNVDNRTVTFTATVTSTTGDFIVPAGVAGSGVNNESLGIDAMFGTTSSSLFGISQSTYPIWASNTFAVGSTSLTLGLLDAAGNKLVNKGASGRLHLYTSPGGFSDLAAEEVTRVRLTGGQVKGEAQVGYNSLSLTLAAGPCEVIGSPWIKNGTSYLWCDDCGLRRIGASDIVHGDPRDLDTLWFNVATSTSYETRSYSLQAAFLDKPAHTVALTGIVNNH